MPVCIAGITAAVQQYSPKIVFLTSPNNPDGSLIQEAELKAILQLPVLVVLDEAYIEFALSRLACSTYACKVPILKGFVHPCLLIIVAHLFLQLSPTDATFACCCPHHWRLDFSLLDSPVLLLVGQKLWL